MLDHFTRGGALMTLALLCACGTSVPLKAMAPANASARPVLADGARAGTAGRVAGASGIGRHCRVQ